jgi:tellurite resistance protein
MALAALKPTPPGLWRRTPPAIFPPTLGLLALALGWRKAGETFGFPAEPGELLLGAVTLLSAFIITTYAVKFIRRPGVVLEDLRILPGRAGLAAGVLCVYLLAAGLGPVAPDPARLLLILGIALHLALTGAMIFVFATGPAEQRRVSPAWHLLFSGWVVAALAAQALGLGTAAAGLFWAALVASVAVWMMSLQQFARQTVPAPLRPLLAVHLAPAAVLGAVAAGQGGAAMAQVFALFSAVGLAILVVRGPWLLAAGFSPLWGAMTFPLAAIANLWLGLGDIWRIPGVVALVAASAIVPLVAIRIYKMWAKGELAPKTGAASA